MTADLATHEHSARQAHSVGRTVLLHLAPGVAAMAVYVAAVPFARHLGLPTIAALAVSALLGVAPVQLAILARTRGPGEPAIRLRARLPVAQMLAWVVVELALAAVAFALTASWGPWLKAMVFGWWPSEWVLDLGTGGGYDRGTLLITAALVLVGSVVVAPVVEELYFRGYLLPRMGARLGPLTPVAHSALFAGYHLWTPWLTPTRLLAVLPLTYVARRTGDLRIGIITHVILNSIDVAVLLQIALSS